MIWSPIPRIVLIDFTKAFVVTFVICMAFSGALLIFASVDTHAKRCDVKQAQPVRVGSATAKPGRPMTVEQLARDGAE